MVDVHEPLVAARELQAFGQSSTEANAVVHRALEDLKMMESSSASAGTDAGTNAEAVVTVAPQRVRGGQAKEDELGKKLGPCQHPSSPHRNHSQGSEEQQEEHEQGPVVIFRQAVAAADYWLRPGSLVAAAAAHSGGPAAMETDTGAEKTAPAEEAGEAVHGMDMEATTETTEDEADRSGKEVPRCDSENLDSSPDSGRRAASLQVNSNSRHICKHCAKEFSSGRALGGHMRAHGSLAVEEAFAALDGVAEKQNQLSGSSMGHHHGSQLFSNSTNGANDHPAVPMSVVKQEGSAPAYSKRSRSNGKEIQNGRSAAGGRRSKPNTGTGTGTGTSKQQHREGTLKNSGEAFGNISKQEEQEENNAGAQMMEPEPSVSSDDDGNNEGAMNEDDGVTDGAASNNTTTTTNNNNNCCDVCDIKFDSSKQLNSHKKKHYLYALRRNPKRSRRFMDQDFTVEAVAAVSLPSAKKTSSMFTSDGNMHECSECDKRFQSWKALFGHMRCHPDRPWRGIRPPTGDVAPKDKQLPGTSSTERQLTSSRRKDVTLPIPASQESDSESEAEGRGGPDHTGHGKAAAADAATSAAAAAAAAGASDNESDTESIEAAYMHQTEERQPSSSAFNWQQFSKRSKRSRQIVRSLQAVTKTAAVPLSTPAENDEMEHETAMGLMMLARKEGGKELWLRAGAAAGGRTSSSELVREPTLDSALSETAKDDLIEQLDNDNASDSEDEEYAQKEDFAHNNKGKGKLDSMDNVSLCEENEEGGDDCDAGEQGVGGNKVKYMCNTCKRVFKSHQALGGHRASHKKVKGCFARTNVSDGAQESPDEEMISEEFRSDEQLPTDLQEQSQSEGDDRERQFSAYSKEDSGEIMNGNRNKSKGHVCTICGRVFNSGQALGGHKRCHYNTKEATSSEATSSTNNTAKLPTAAGHHHGAGGQSRVYKDEPVQQGAPPRLEESVTKPEKAVSEELTQPAAPVRPVTERFLDLNLPAPTNDDDMEVEAYVMPPQNMVCASLPKKIDSRGTPDFSSAIGTVKSSNFDGELDTGKPKDGYFPLYPASYPSLVEESNQDQDGGQDTGFRGEEVEFRLRYVVCNVCDMQFTGLEALINHEKTHASMVSSVSGLTPISA